MTDLFVFHEDLRSLRNKAPLVVSVTNSVSANFTANAMLAAGASPIMTDCREELPELLSKAKALVINVGTVDCRQAELMLDAARLSVENSLPWVLDPAGCAASSFRLGLCLKLVREYKPAIIRGNASEIISMAQGQVPEGKFAARGVDSRCRVEDAVQSAGLLARNCGAVVCVSGKEDYIVDCNSEASVSGGSALMSRVTGMGCTASAISACFAAVDSNRFEACRKAMILMKHAGTIAESDSDGPGSFALGFIDAIWNAL